MTSQTDKLFREKLENFSIPASSAAWSRIEVRLDQPNRTFGWLKIAASVTIISIATFLLWPTSSTQQSEVASLSKPSAVPSASKEVIAIDKKDDVVENNISETQLSNKKTTQAKGVIISPVKIEKSIPEELIAEVMPAQSEINTTETTVVLETVAHVDEESSQTIIYSVEEVNAKFLKKELIAEATTEEKKTSGIQKLIGVAYNLASADAGLGNIRQRKDEVLALNFRDKKQGQN